MKSKIIGGLKIHAPKPAGYYVVRLGTRREQAIVGTTGTSRQLPVEPRRALRGTSRASSEIMASKNEKTPLMGGGDGHKRSDSQPSYYFLQRTTSLQRSESAIKGAEGGEVVDLPPEGASSTEFDSRPVAVRFPFF
jgi:hypothetical protein